MVIWRWGSVIRSACPWKTSFGRLQQYVPKTTQTESAERSQQERAGNVSAAAAMKKGGLKTAILEENSADEVARTVQTQRQGVPGTEIK